MNVRAALLTAVFVAVAVSACSDGETTAPSPVTGGDAAAGRAAITQYGCASCHAIPDVPSVTNGMGPDLDHWADQLYIAGQVPNRPEELIRWIRDPQALVPGTAMPNSGVTEQEARDIAAYLYAR